MSQFFKIVKGKFIPLTEDEVLNLWNRFCQNNPLYNEMEVVEMSDFDNCDFSGYDFSKDFNKKDKYFIFDTFLRKIVSFNDLSTCISLEHLGIYDINTVGFVARDKDEKLHLFFGEIPWKDSLEGKWTIDERDTIILNVPTKCFPRVLWRDENPKMLSASDRITAMNDKF